MLASDYSGPLDIRLFGCLAEILFSCLAFRLWPEPAFIGTISIPLSLKTNLWTSLEWPVPRDLTMKMPRVRFVPPSSSNSLTTIQVSIKDETPISPFVSFPWEEETRLVKNVVISRSEERRVGTEC